MTAKDTQGALRKLRKLVKGSPHVEQDLSKWYDVQAKEIEPGQWRMMINAESDQIIYFSYWELSMNELHAAMGFTDDHPKGTEFQPTISIDTPKGSGGEPGAHSAAVMTRDQLRQQVQDAVAKAGTYTFEPKPAPTLGERIKKVVRMIRLRLRL